MEHAKDASDATRTVVTVDETPAAERVATAAHSTPLVLLTVFAVIFILDWAQTIFIPLVTAVLLSYALSPLVERLYRWHVPRVASAAAALLLIVGGTGAMAYSLYDETVNMIQTLPEAAQKIRRSIADEWSESRGTIEHVQKAAEEIGRVAQGAAPPAPAAPKGVTRVQIESPRFDVRAYLWDGTIGVLSAASLTLIVLILTFFLLVSGDRFRRKLVHLSGPTLSKKKVTVQVLDEINDHIQRYLLVQVFTSVLVGIATWLAFLWVGLDHAAVWGVAAAVLNLIPYLGAIVTTAGAGLVAFLQFGSLSMLVTVAAISLVINTIEGYLLTPWMSGRAARLNGVVVFAGLLFWGWLWGAWGLLLGMPIMMAIKSVCDRVEEFRPVGELMGD